MALWLVASALPATPPKSREPQGEIQVHNVEELYAALRPSVNCEIARTCGLRIHLAPGIYVLSDQTPTWPPRPRNGALRLPFGVSLVGSERHVDTDGDGVPDPIDPANPDVFAVPGTETRIDGSQLNLPSEERADCAGEFRFFPDPVISIGSHNAISSLTVVGGANVPIGEPTNSRVEADGSLSIEITDTVLEGDGIAMTFANSECPARHARSELRLSHSVLRGGLLIQNFYTGDASDDPTGGPEIRAVVAFNLFSDAGTGLRAAAADEGADGGSVTLHMAGNLFRNNGTNLQLRGAVGRDGLRTVGNRLVVMSASDTFGEAPRSVFVSAGAGDAFSNVVMVSFFDSRFIRDSPDTPPEFTIVGGEGAASDDHASISIRGATVRTSDGEAVEGGLAIADETGSGEPPGTARLAGSRSDFLLLNQGLPAPPEHFFLGH
jgi:hypothetical protein